MKKLLLLSFFISIGVISPTQAQKFTEVSSPDGSKKLLGTISKENLLNEPYKSWFIPQYENYFLESSKLSPQNPKTKNIKVKVFMGTWCGDTKREVPRFIKISEAIGIETSAMELICVDNDENKYKQSPANEEKGLSIHRVPTFIFYENGSEIGRIVESPVISFEQDMINILNKNRFYSNYNASTNALKLIDAGQFEYFTEHTKEFLDEWKASIKSSSELNSVGYVLLAQQKYNEAIFIFKLNTELFHNVANTFDSLAEAYEKKGDKEMALNYYNKVLEMNPKSESAIKKISDLKK